MPGFTYMAVDIRGKEKRGSIEADNKEKVIDILKNDGLIPVSVKEQGALNKDIDFSIGKKVKPRDLSVFCRQFVSITQAGVPMKEALQMLSEQTQNKWLKRAISEVLLSVEKVNTLAVGHVTTEIEENFPDPTPTPVEENPSYIKEIWA